MEWFDGHLDLAYLALEGRAMAESLAEATQGPQPPAVTLTSLRQGGVRWALGTIFPVPKMYASYGYAKGDIEATHEQSKRQLAQYHAWEREGLIEIVRAGDQLREPTAQRDDESPIDEGDHPLQVVILMEGAAPIRTPDELAWWHEQGVRVIGMSWAIGSQYAGGNHSKGPLTDAGYALVDHMDALGVIHDLSHLSDEAAWGLLEHTWGPVVATHSNCRALLDGKDQRHLSDPLIQAIGERGGIIGLNLLSRFLSKSGKSRRATVKEALLHVEHICGLLGHNRAVALGSDMDGGFGANQLPEGINAPADLIQLTPNVSWDGSLHSSDLLFGFPHRNWLRFLRQALPGAAR